MFKEKWSQLDFLSETYAQYSSYKWMTPPLRLGPKLEFLEFMRDKGGYFPKQNKIPVTC